MMSGPVTVTEIEAIYAKYSKADHEKYGPMFVATKNQDRDAMGKLTANLGSEEKRNARLFITDMLRAHSDPAAIAAYQKKQASDIAQLEGEIGKLKLQRDLVFSSGVKQVASQVVPPSGADVRRPVARMTK